jgi:type IV pilus assembly protein PilC
MPEFNYRAIDTAGSKLVRGVLVAYGLQDAEEKLAGMGLAPVEVTPRVTRRTLAWHKPTRGHVLGFSVQLHSMLCSGVPVATSLEQIAANEPHPGFRRLVEDVRQRVEHEGSLSAALAAHPEVFPPFYLGAIRAGEAGGTLGSVLHDLVRTLERQQEFDAQLKQAMIYPIFVVALLTGVGVLYMGFVLPQILKMVRELGGSLPITTRVLMSLSDAFAQAWFLLPIGAAALAAGIWRVRRTPRGQLLLDTALLRVPLLGEVIRKTTLAKFAHYLALLLQSGYELLPSLELVKGTMGNACSARAVERTQMRIQGGEALSSAMRGLAFAPFVISMVAVGEKTGLVGGQLEKVAEYYEHDVERALKRLLALLEPVILILFGSLAAIVIMSTFMPMYQSMSLAK